MALNGEYTMSYKFTKSEVYRTNYQVIKIGQPFEAQYLFREYQREGWNEGIQWNYDIYDINGKRFLVGNVEPDTHIFSMKKLKELGLAARNASNIEGDYSGEKRREAINKLMEDFCSSIDKGIHDPSKITAYPTFIKNLSEQKEMFPEKSFETIADELYNNSIDGNTKEKREEVQAKIDAELKKLCLKYSNAMRKIPDNQKKENLYMLAISDYQEKQRIKDLKTAPDFNLKCEILNHIKDDTIFDFVANNAYRMEKEHLSDLFFEMNCAMTTVFPPETKEFNEIYKSMKENLIENCNYGEIEQEKKILDMFEKPKSLNDSIRNESWKLSKDMMKDLIKEFDYAVYSNTEGKLNKSARKDYLKNLKENMIEYRDYLDVKPKSKEIAGRGY